MQNQITIIVAAEPGHYRTSLVALLATIPQISKVKIVDNIFRIIEDNESASPDLLLVETAQLNEDVQTWMKLLAEKWPMAQRILLVEQFGRFEFIDWQNATYVLRKEIAAGDFISLIRQLVPASSEVIKSEVVVQTI